MIDGSHVQPGIFDRLRRRGDAELNLPAHHLDAFALFFQVFVLGRRVVEVLDLGPHVVGRTREGGRFELPNAAFAGQEVRRKDVEPDPQGGHDPDTGNHNTS